MMFIGVDSYSYHRLFGDVRPGEVPATERWHDAAPLLKHARSLALDYVLLETCFLPSPEEINRDIFQAARPTKVALSWGHPRGLEGGRSRSAEADARRWMECAADLGHTLMRITAGSPHTRGAEPAADLIARLTLPLRHLSDEAEKLGLKLALENHADMRAAELVELLARVDHPALTICLDNVNLLRVGDDLISGVRLLAPLTTVVHLKDCRPGDPCVEGGPVSVTLGTGVINLPAILAELAAANISGPICVEFGSLGPNNVDERAMIEASVCWLRRHLAVSDLRPSVM
jgi:sugar phosphate isomerase/epimerase